MKLVLYHASRPLLGISVPGLIHVVTFFVGPTPIPIMESTPPSRGSVESLFLRLAPFHNFSPPATHVHCTKTAGMTQEQLWKRPQSPDPHGQLFPVLGTKDYVGLVTSTDGGKHG